MSGGSYDYFYSRVTDRLHDVASTLEAMAEQCEERSKGPPERDRDGNPLDFTPLHEVAEQLNALALTLRKYAATIQRWERTLQCIEWWASSDWGPYDVIEAFRKIEPQYLIKLLADTKGSHP